MQRIYLQIRISCLAAGIFCHAARAAEPQLTPEQEQRVEESERYHTQTLDLLHTGKYAEAIAPAQQALEIRRASLGENHPYTAISYSTLAEAYRLNRKLTEAETNCRKALAIRQKVLEPNDSSLATSYNNLATIVQTEGKYAEAASLYPKALAIWEKVYGADHVMLGSVLNNMAEMHRELGEYDKAEPLYQRALRIREKAHGPDDLDVALSQNNLARLYAEEGKYAEAEELNKRALRTREKLLGGNHPDVAQSLGNLAEVYRLEQKFAQAEPLCLHALKIRQTALGPNDPTVGISTLLLAEIYRGQAKDAQAETLYKRSIKILEDSLGRDHASVGEALMDLAVLYKSQQRYDDADPLYRRGLKIQEKTLGLNHPQLGTIYNNLAEFYRGQGKYAEAEPLYAKAMKIQEKTLGSDNPTLATTIGNLALMYKTQGKYAQAEPLYERALQITEQRLGPNDPFVSTNLVNLFCLQVATGKWQKAMANENRGRRLIRRYIIQELPALAANDQLAYLHADDEKSLHCALSLAVVKPDDRTVAEHTASWLLNAKAVSQEAITQNLQLARETGNPEVGKTVKELLETRSQLAALVYGPAEQGQDAARHKQVEQLQQREEELSHQLAASTSGQLRITPWFEIEALRKAIPADAVFIDISRFDVFNFNATLGDEKWKPARYMAWIVPSDGRGEIRVVDLGEADKIDAAVQSVRSGMDRAVEEMNRAAAQKKTFDFPGQEKTIQKPLTNLAELILEPVLKQVGTGPSQLLVSPDAALWLAPWSAMPLKDGRYLIEQYQIRYLVSGRDLVQEPSANPASGNTQQERKTTVPAIFADPAYDLGPSEVSAATRSVLRGVAAANRTRSLAPQKPAGALPRVPRLKGTAAEAEAIKPKLASYTHTDPVTYLDKFATEGVFKNLSRPQVLVLSTHGFFFSDQDVPSGDLATTGTANPPRRDAPVLAVDGKPVENPLLRCGLLLAGCNQSARSSIRNAQSGQAADTTDDGVLTGMEIVGTDLRGTELVMLSACETGLGQIRSGEGVAGLRQAFQLAGAKSVVATLWQIPDKDSTQLVSNFFTHLADGKSKSEALRKAQVELIDLHRSRYNAAHPFFWAAFTITGH